MIGPTFNTTISGLITAAEPLAFAHRTAAGFGIPGGTMDNMAILGADAANIWHTYEPANELVFNESQNGPSTSVGRCIAYAIRISMISEVQGTRGYVEFFQPTEMPGGATAVAGYVNSMSSNRRGPAYRRHFFSMERTFTYVWEPICDDIEEALIMGTASVVQALSPSRLALHVGGVDSTAAFTIEVISITELAGRTFAAMASPGTQSPDADHLTNAMVREYGQTNGGRGLDGREISGRSFLEGVTLDKLRVAAGEGFQLAKEGLATASAAARLYSG
jgi:hypothetical protein